MRHLMLVGLATWILLDPGNLALATGQPEQKILPVERIGQETQQWCWAAAAQMVMSYHGKPIYEQCKLAQLNPYSRNTKGKKQLLPPHADFDCCKLDSAAASEACVLPGSPFRALREKGFDFKYHTAGDFDKKYHKGRWQGEPGALSWQTLKEEIDNNRPFIFAFKGQGDVGHVMVGIGYAEIPDLGNWVVVNDPFPPRLGDTMLFSFDFYRKGTYQPGSQYWEIEPVKGRKGKHLKHTEPDVQSDPLLEYWRPPATATVAEKAPGDIREYIADWAARSRATGDPDFIRQFHQDLTAKLRVATVNDSHEAWKVAKGALDVIKALAEEDSPSASFALERPLPIYQLLFEDLACSERLPTHISQLKRTEEFFFPVTEDGAVTALVKIRQDRGKWEIISIGHPEMARTLTELERDHGRVLHLIWMPSLYQYFVGIELDEDMEEMLSCPPGFCLRYIPTHADPMLPRWLGGEGSPGAASQGEPTAETALFDFITLFAYGAFGAPGEGGSAPPWRSQNRRRFGLPDEMFFAFLHIMTEHFGCGQLEDFLSGQRKECSCPAK